MNFGASPMLMKICATILNVKLIYNKIKTPMIFFKVIGSAFTKKDNPTKIDIDPDIDSGATSFQSKHFNAFGKIVIAPKI